METIASIKEQLKILKQETEWFSELRKDHRSGVQKLVKSWDSKQAKLKIEWEDYLERSMFDRNYSVPLIAGVDEAGRGPLAGPVVTAAVILPQNTEVLVHVNDSKQLSREKRTALAELIKQNALSYSIHIQPVEEIDRLNIYEATKQSMKAAVEALSITPEVVLADAMQIPIVQPCHSIIKGDAKSLSIAAASILAKTERDHYMDKLHEKFPEYGFSKHAGYGTAQHIEAIQTYGICPEHRTTFEPIKSMLKA